MSEEDAPINATDMADALTALDQRHRAERDALRQRCTHRSKYGESTILPHTVYTWPDGHTTVKYARCWSCYRTIEITAVQKKEAEEADDVRRHIQRIFTELAFALELHERWVKEGPWLTGPICWCHPDVHLSKSAPLSF